MISFQTIEKLIGIKDNIMKRIYGKFEKVSISEVDKILKGNPHYDFYADKFCLKLFRYEDLPENDLEVLIFEMNDKKFKYWVTYFPGTKEDLEYLTKEYETTNISLDYFLLLMNIQALVKRFENAFYSIFAIELTKIKEDKH